MTTDSRSSRRRLSEAARTRAAGPPAAAAASSRGDRRATSPRPAAELEAENEAEIRNLLERLGDPADIAAEERARSGRRAERRAGPVEILALIGLLVGGFVFVIGWFVGLVLLWVSEHGPRARSSSER